MDSKLKRCNAPLHILDTSTETYGCRYGNPDGCVKCYLEGVCAFVRKDKICQSPPWSWAKRYLLLKLAGENEGNVYESKEI
ncbi:MAG: hypothetical protein EOM87_06615 [Clostridia bacterium]|nr:hypothetical protein [Clostridia bacterium]